MQARGRTRGMFRFLLLLAMVGALPFAAWRAPKPKRGPITITGQVRHQVLDQAPDLLHHARTLFEALLGNLPINLHTGQRIYVSPADYELCWPEPWEAIYEKGYTIAVTATAQPLFLGGYGVAKIEKTERIDRPAADAQPPGASHKAKPEAHKSSGAHWTRPGSK